MNPFEFENSGTDELCCPNPACDYEYQHSYEYFDAGQEDAVIRCHQCGKDFAASRSITVTYSTEVLKK